MEAIRSNGHTGIPAPILSAILVLVTLITGGVLEEMPVYVNLSIKASAYIITVLAIIVWSSPLIRNPRDKLIGFWNAYRRTILFPLLAYLAGLTIGALRGPEPFYSLWQTMSEIIVFLLALAGFGWLNTRLVSNVRALLKSISILSLALMCISLVLYIGNLTKLWSVNVFISNVAGNQILMNGPFNHANVLGYVLMTGCLSSLSLALDRPGPAARIWWVLVGFLSVGVLPTFARGAILGTLFGGLTALLSRRKELLRFIILAAAALVLLIVLAYSRGTLALMDFTPSVLRLPREEFTGYEDMDHEEWLQKLERDNGQIVLHGNGTITSPPIELRPQSYRLVVDGYGTKGQASPEDDFRTPFITITILQGSEDAAQRSVQLADRRSYHDVLKFVAPSLESARVRISFSDDAFLEPGNDRSVFINDIYIANSWVPILDWSIVDYLPKVGSSGRWKMWAVALGNLKDYGPLGVGAGNAESWPGWSTHNVFLEQYGEGGILTLLGFITWLVLPIIHINRSRLPRELALSIVAMMAGLIVHGLFWTQFLDGLRFLTVVYVPLWTALATQRMEPASEKMGAG